MSVGMSHGMVQQLGQRMDMVLTPQMRQALEILQLQRQDLEQRLVSELSSNPALELEEFSERPDDAAPLPDDDFLRPDEAPDRSEDARDTELAIAADSDPYEDNPYSPSRDDAFEETGPVDRSESVESAEPATDNDPATAFDDPDAGLEPVGDFSRLDDVDTDWDELHEDRTSRASASRGGDDEDAFDPILHAPARGQSFIESLTVQLGLAEIPPRVRTLAEAMLAWLDDGGYLSRPPRETVPEDFSPPPTDDELHAALTAVQSLDPAGVGARDLRECLALQLDRIPEDDPDDIARRIVTDHLEDLAANRIPKIAKALGVTVEAVNHAVTLIRTLAPRPGRGGGDETESRAVRPDAVIRETDDGGLEVRLPHGVPVEVSDFYVALFERSRRAKALRERFLSDPDQAPAFLAARELVKQGGDAGRQYRQLYEAATGLLKAVSMRDQTLLRTVREIARRQSAYLLGHEETPAPLMMQEVAEAIGYDDSTISRTVKDKYVDTPRGVIPLRDLFTRAAIATGGRAFSGQPRQLPASPSSSGSATSAPDASTPPPPPPGAATPAYIMQRLRELIEAENKKKPLKDNELQDKMAAMGFPLARRTVAHYRGQMGFPSHSQRREY